jgi:hypothetical protein
MEPYRSTYKLKPLDTVLVQMSSVHNHNSINLR